MASLAPILYSYKRCPYAIRARICLALGGVPVQLREVNLKGKPAHLLQVSPKGTVPVLYLGYLGECKADDDNGGGAAVTVIEESREIMEWALRRRDPLQLLRADGVDVATLDRFDSDFKFHLDRYKYAYRFQKKKEEEKQKEKEKVAEGEVSAAKEEEVEEAAEVDHREECMLLLSELEAKLAHGQGWLGGAGPGFTDVALLPFVRQFRIADEKFFNTELQQRLPCVYDWLVHFLTWDPFLKVMVKFVPWNPDDDVVLFNPSVEDQL